MSVTLKIPTKAPVPVAPAIEEPSTSLKQLVIDALTTKPCRRMLGLLEKNELGAKALNRISYPRIAFKSFEEAWEAARKVSYAGHDHPDYMQFQVGLSGILRSSDYAVLYWLSRTGMNPLRVLDYAGSVGNIYYSYRAHLHEFADGLDWMVFDLPGIMEAGKHVAEEQGEQDLRFVASLNDLDGDFVVHISSAFHYWEKSISEFVSQLPFRPVHIIVNRVPVTADQDTFITVQYKKTYAVPCIVRNTRKFVSDFAVLGYTLIDSWSAPELRINMPLLPSHHVPAYSGFYFRLHS